MHNRVAIFGGSFDPLHNGHIEIAKLASVKFDLDKIIFIPAYISPHKTGKTITPPEIRFQMVKNSLDNSKFEISDFEILKQNKSYTSETIRHFTSNVINSNDELYLIIGEDSKIKFNTWKDYNYILDKVKVISVSRTSNATKSVENIFVDDRFLELKISNIDISSTDIRDRVKRELDISNLVPIEVSKIIAKERLYINEKRI